MIQLSITVSFIALFVYHPAVKEYSRGHPEMQWIALIMTFVLLIVLACCSDFRRRWPLNIILLGAFTLCEGFMLGSVASYYKVCLKVSLLLYSFTMFFFLYSLRMSSLLWVFALVFAWH
jgi:FtsH-binding integral membrane protein